MILATRFDPRLLAAAIALLGAAFWVPAPLRIPLLAIAIATAVLAPLPLGTRGVVFAVMTGLATGIAAINLFAVGIFQGPLTREFGWSQAQYTLVTPIGTLITVVTSLWIGRLFDRRGVRRLALISIVLLALVLMSLYFLDNNLLHFYAVFAIVPIIGAGTSSIAYSRVIAQWFDRRRGQAFGASLAGIGIGGAVLSLTTQSLINQFGWRLAYVGLAALSLLVTLPIIFWQLKDTPTEMGLGRDGEPLQTPPSVAAQPAKASRAAIVTGYSAAESRRLPRFWRMLLAFLLMAFAIGGVMLQLVPILIARGIDKNQAAATIGMLGLALIVGRAFAGFLMDRVFAPHVAAAIIVFPLIGVSLLASGAVGWQAQVAAICVGLAAGAELDVIAVLITRYFGTRAYAENYGWQYAAWTLGSGTAPLLTAFVYDRLRTHTPILWVYVGLFALSALLVARLGSYPELNNVSADVAPSTGNGDRGAR